MQRGEQALDACRGGAHDPVVGAVGERRDRLAQRRAVVDRVDGDDGRRLDHLGALLAQQPGETPDPVTGTGHHHAPTEQRAALEPVELLGGDHADDDDRRRCELVVAERRQRGPGRPLLGAGPPLHRRRRGGRVEAAVDEPPGDRRPTGHAHQDHDRAADPGDRVPVDARSPLATPSASSCFDGSSWPVTTVNEVDEWRSVTGMPA